jgi:hypothetical protein
MSNAKNLFIKRIRRQSDLIPGGEDTAQNFAPHPDIENNIDRKNGKIESAVFVFHNVETDDANG